MLDNKRTYFKWLTFLAMAFVVVNTAADVLVYKMIQVGSFLMSVGVFIVPFSYACSDIVTEVYGYKCSRQIIWFGLISELVFDTIGYLATYIHSPAFINNDAAFNQIFRPLLHVYFAVLVASFLSDFINIYCVSKWKILLRGRYFWLRSIGATGVAEFAFTFICDGLVFYSTLSGVRVFQTIASTFAVKILFAIILSFPAAVIAYLLKKSEGIDEYDYNVNFNPLKLSN